MYKELTVSTSLKNYKVFIQNGFYSYVAPSPYLHAHSFTELHIVMCNDSVLNVNNTDHILKSGDMAVIPKGMYHRCTSADDVGMHTAFQINCDTNSFAVYNIGQATAENFFREIHRAEITDDFSVFSAYVAIFASYFDEAPPLKALPVTNQKFIIREFLSQNYNNDIHLSDLAEVLHVSERHAERLVIEHMGKSFREELTMTRMRIAENLLQTSNMPLAKIASYVGYKSYSGFWKAMQKYRDT